MAHGDAALAEMKAEQGVVGMGVPGGNCCVDFARKKLLTAGSYNNMKRRSKRSRSDPKLMLTAGTSCICGNR